MHTYGESGIFRSSAPHFFELFHKSLILMTKKVEKTVAFLEFTCIMSNS